MNKRVVFIAVGAVLLLVLLLSSFLFARTSSKNSTGQSSVQPTKTTAGSSMTGGTGDNTETVQQPTSAPGQVLAPEQVVGNFYSWYISHQGVSALTSGAYKKSPYLTDSFKQNIAGFAPYTAEHDPVFCAANKTADYALQAAEQRANNKVNVAILDAKTNRSLFTIVLVNENGLWLIDDTICRP